MPKEITTAAGQRLRVFTSQDIIDAHRRGFEDAGGKNYNTDKKYTKEDLQKAYSEGTEYTNRTNYDIAKKAYESGYKQATAEMNATIQNTREQGYSLGHAKGYASGYTEGCSEERTKLQTERRKLQTEREALDKKLANLRINAILKSKIPQFSFFNYKLPVMDKPQKVLLLLAAPCAAGFFSRLLIEKYKKPQANFQLSSQR